MARFGFITVWLIVLVTLAATHAVDVPRGPIFDNQTLVALSSGPDNLPDGGTWPGIPADQTEQGPGGPYHWSSYDYYCGVFATGIRTDIAQAWTALLYHSKDMTCSAPARTCKRLWCYQTTAVYLCNDNDEEITISCWNAGYFVCNLSGLCCFNQREHAGQSGQMFHPTANYNVVMGYGNCNYNTGPYPPGAGNNPACVAG